MKYPESIGKLILANTFIRIREAPAFALRYFTKMRSQGMPSITMLEGSIPWLFSAKFLKDDQLVSGLMQLVEKYPYPQSMSGQKRQMEALLQFNSETWFKKISAPTLVIEGCEDIICPIDSERLAKGIPGARLVKMSDQAHMAHIEKPMEFAKVILDFLK